NIKDAAAKAGISVRTVNRRINDPAFKAKLQELRDNATHFVLVRLVALGTAALDTLQQLLNARLEPVRLGAARAILELGRQLRETEEHAERIAQLERLAKENNGEYETMPR